MTEIVKVVNHEVVEQLTREGWRLTELLANASEPHFTNTLIRPAGNDPNHCWQPEVYSVTTIAVTRPLFVMRKDVEIISREDALAAQYLHSCKELEETRKEGQTFKREAESANSAKNNALEQKSMAETQRNNALKDVQKQKDINEEHKKLIDRVRREIGDAKWRELEGSHTSCVICIENQK